MLKRDVKAWRSIWRLFRDTNYMHECKFIKIAEGEIFISDETILLLHVQKYWIDIKLLNWKSKILDIRFFLIPILLSCVDIIYKQFNFSII